MLTFRHFRGRIRLLTAMVGGYWLLLFIATHIPLQTLAKVGVGDKWLHFGAYAALAWLLAWAFSQRTPLRGSRYVLIWLVVCTYGVIDELLQSLPQINRHCDLQDWFADVAGATCSLLLFYLATAVWRAFRRSQRSAENAG